MAGDLLNEGRKWFENLIVVKGEVLHPSAQLQVCGGASESTLIISAIAGRALRASVLAGGSRLPRAAAKAMLITQSVKCLTS